MDLSKRYIDIDGNKCTILEMVERHPAWSAIRIQEGEKAISKLAELEMRMDRIYGSVANQRCPQCGTNIYELSKIRIK